MKRRLLVVTTIVLVLAMALMVFVGCNDAKNDNKDEENKIDKPATDDMSKPSTDDISKPTKDYTVEEEKAIITKVFGDMCDDVASDLDKYEGVAPDKITADLVKMVTDGLDKSLGIPKYTTKIIASNEMVIMATKDKNYPIEADNITGSITCVFDNDFYVASGKWTQKKHEMDDETQNAVNKAELVNALEEANNVVTVLKGAHLEAYMDAIAQSGVCPAEDYARIIARELTSAFAYVGNIKEVWIMTDDNYVVTCVVITNKLAPSISGTQSGNDYVSLIPVGDSSRLPNIEPTDNGYASIKYVLDEHCPKLGKNMYITIKVENGKNWVTGPMRDGEQ